jgi:hypothetical protein
MDQITRCPKCGKGLIPKVRSQGTPSVSETFRTTTLIVVSRQTGKRDETNAHPCGHPVAWRVCHRSRADQPADQRSEHGDRRGRAVRPGSDRRNRRRLQYPCARAGAPFGVSLSAALTAFGCASDPLGAPTYQIPAEAGAVITGPVGSIGVANAQNVKPNATSGTGGAGAGVSSRAGCLGAGDFASAAIGGC